MRATYMQTAGPPVSAARAGPSAKPRRAMADSVSLDELASAGGRKPFSLTEKGSLKILITLFLIFTLVVSDVFTDNVVAGFRGAVQCRTPTVYGIVLQGIFLVLFYIAALRLIEGGLI